MTEEEKTHALDRAVKANCDAAECVIKKIKTRKNKLFGSASRHHKVSAVPA